MIDFSEGFVCIPRGIRRHWLWGNAKYYEWWNDLLMMAAYEPGIVRFGKHKVPIKRGELVASQRMLLHRWGTNGRIVRMFLDDLEEEDIISRELFTSYTIVTISNFDLFQGGKNTPKKGKRNNAENEFLEQEKQHFRSHNKNNIIKNNKKSDDKKGSITEIFDEAMQKSKVEIACMKYSITEEQYKKFVHEIIKDWEYADEKDRTLKHLLFTLPYKVADFKKSKTNGINNVDKRNISARTDNSKTGENPLGRAKVHQTKTEHDLS